MDFPINNYPTKAETDPDVLYQSLGTFWTQIFQDKGTLKGYTIALAEEITQRYYDLIEVIDSYSVTDVPLFHTEKWFPITVLRSEFGSAPLLFSPTSEVFGLNTNDEYYQNTTFQFGFPKVPVAEVYLYDVGPKLKNFSVIADRIINPGVVLTYGVDVQLNGTVLAFNRNIFEDPNIAKSNVISADGEKVTFVDKAGNVLDEQMIILWAYHGKLDTEILYKNFGIIFNLHQNNDAFFKSMLEAIFALHINGPTVRNIKTICAAFLGIKPIAEATEEVVEIFSDSHYQFVVTDKTVYRLELYYNLLPSVRVGAIFHAGDVLVDAIEYYDNVSYPNGWWLNDSVVKKHLALSQYLFLGDYKYQLLLKNGIDLATLDGAGNIHFPIEGATEDIARFNTYLNSNPINKEIIKTKLGLVNPGDAVPLHPIDFVMTNFLKNNCALLKFKFSSQDIQAKFLALLPMLKTQLPPYIYIIFDLELRLDVEEYKTLNNSSTISYLAGVQTRNADSSDTAGWIDRLAPGYYMSVDIQPFVIARALPTQAYEIVAPRGVGGGGSLIITDGTLLADHAPTPGDTSANINKLLLLDFRLLEPC